MGHHEAHCNADPNGPVGNPGCSCEAGREIKRLRLALAEIAMDGDLNGIIDRIQRIANDALQPVK